MYPAPFDYHTPKTIDEALALMKQHGDEAKLLAGGHSLLPLMKLRLATPAVIIDIGRLPDLAYIREEGNAVVIGALTTHAMAASSLVLRQKYPMLAEAAAAIGDPQVRNRGTLGGSLAHADPAGDWPATVLAADAEIVATSQSGQRTISARKFFVDLMTTAIGPNEILREIRVPLPPPRTGSAYLKVRQPASGFAVVGIAARVTVEQGVCRDVAVGVTGLAATPRRAAATEAALKGRGIDEASAAAAAEHAADGADPLSDLYASAEYRVQLARVYTKRALLAAAARV